MKKLAICTRSFLCIVIAQIICFSATAQPPAKYYDSAFGKTCAALKTALKKITQNGKTPKTYSNLWSQYPKTDIKPRTVGSGTPTVIYDIYSSVPGGSDTYQFEPSTNQCGTYTKEGDCYNREHSVPLSWFNGNTSVNGNATDYNFIFPTDGFVNAKRSNWPYGEVGTASYTSINGSKLGTSKVAGISGTVFEPIDSFKGDVARAFFYFVTHYEDDMVTNAGNADAAQAFAANTFPSIKIPFLKMMIKWHNLDPVSYKERLRNNGSYSFQRNRNPFVDSPNYVNLVWNSLCPGLSALPVQFINLSGTIVFEQAKLTWQVEDEVNMQYYEIQKSTNGTRFETIQQVKALALNQFSFTDASFKWNNETVYYRIKSVDINGNNTYSDILTLQKTSKPVVQVIQNPTKHVLKLSTSLTNTTVQISIYTLSGKLVSQQRQMIANSLIQVPIHNLTSGMYFVSVNNDKQVFNQPFMVY